MNSRIKHFYNLLLIVVFAMTNCQAKMIVDNTKVRIHVVEEFTTVEESLNSHSGLELSSSLEPMYDYIQVLEDDFLVAPIPDSASEQKSAVYPRVKRMADGRYIMFYQGGQVASRILYSISSDLKYWSEPVILWSPFNITTVEGKDVRRFTTADAVVLPEGDILAVCSYRASSGYKNGLDCGLVLKRSSDNGATWSEPQYIYEGTNWEPYLLYLPNGDIQCYFTDCIPSIKDSGTSVITSHDGGQTWGEYKRISRQFKYVSDGHKIFTDQMPSVRLLNDGNTLCGFFEARLEPDFPADDASVFKMSLVYNNGYDWEDLGNDKEGPQDRQTNLFEGAGGYISVFPSGETLISCNIDGVFSLKLGDADARRFNGRTWETDWLQPFEGRAFWGSTEVISDHETVGAVYAPEGLSIGKFYLNHAMNANHEAIKLDGNPEEWKQEHIFYLGSDSPTQAIIRAAYDDYNLYVLVERICDTSTKVYTEMYFQNALTTQSASKSIYAKVSSAGLDKVENATAVASAQEGVTVDGRKGTVVELAIPLFKLNAKKGDEILFNAALRGPGLNDGFTRSNEKNPSTWMKIRLQ